MWNIAVSLAIAYAAVLALVYLFQPRLVYFPDIGREAPATPLAHGLAYDAVKISTDDGETLSAWWVPAQAMRGAVLLLHGNAGNIAHRIDYAAMFARLGYATLLVDYRGYGASTGKPSEEGTYRDAAASWRWLTAKGVRAADIVIYGESLGGGVASWLAKEHPPRALVLASTFTSMPALGQQIYPFLPVRWLSRFSYDTLARLDDIAAPVFVAHSRNDEIVPFSHGERLYAAARGQKRFLEMQGGHNETFVFSRGEWASALGAFLEQAAALPSVKP
jgi:fermentation-respiration switch protein FrsA (DUF1100 family)